MLDLVPHQFENRAKNILMTNLMAVVGLLFLTCYCNMNPSVFHTAQTKLYCTYLQLCTLLNLYILQ